MDLLSPCQWDEDLWLWTLFGGVFAGGHHRRLPEGFALPVRRQWLMPLRDASLRRPRWVASLLPRDKAPLEMRLLIQLPDSPPWLLACYWSNNCDSPTCTVIPTLFAESKVFSTSTGEKTNPLAFLNNGSIFLVFSLFFVFFCDIDCDISKLLKINWLAVCFQLANLLFFSPVSHPISSLFWTSTCWKAAWENNAAPAAELLKGYMLTARLPSLI